MFTHAVEFVNTRWDEVSVLFRSTSRRNNNKLTVQGGFGGES
jgi:hypothetical protein